MNESEGDDTKVIARDIDDTSKLTTFALGPEKSGATVG